QRLGRRGVTQRLDDERADRDTGGEREQDVDDPEPPPVTGETRALLARHGLSRLRRLRERRVHETGLDAFAHRVSTSLGCGLRSGAESAKNGAGQIPSSL